MTTVLNFLMKSQWAFSIGMFHARKIMLKEIVKSIFAKDIAKATTERILRKIFLQIKTYRYKKLYTKLSNYCVSLFRKFGKRYCEKLNINDTRDNKIRDKKTDEYYQWTDRYYEWSDRYYEWTDEY